VTKQQVLAAARELSAYQPGTEPPKVAYYGTLQKTGYRIEKLVYQSEPGISLPAVLAIPAELSPKREAVLYADGQGKSAVASRLNQWMKEGTVVLAVDLRGLGETENRPVSRGDRAEQDWFGDASSSFGALLLGKTLVGMRAADLSKAVDLLNARTDLGVKSIRAIGVGRGSVPVLFAGALDHRIHSVELERMLVSYQSVVDTPIHRYALEDVVPGVLRRFDLPDLVAALGSKVARVSKPVDAMGDLAP
jgi:hypothetical protein